MTADWYVLAACGGAIIGTVEGGDGREGKKSLTALVQSCNNFKVHSKRNQQKYVASQKTENAKRAVSYCILDTTECAISCGPRKQTGQEKRGLAGILKGCRAPAGFAAGLLQQPEPGRAGAVARSLSLSGQQADKNAKRRNMLSITLAWSKVFNFVIAKISATTEITEFRKIRPKFCRNSFRD